MKKFFTLALFLIAAISQKTYAQPTVQDCLGAIPVCLNTYNEYNGYLGTGTVNDIPTSSCPITCMSAGERNSVWYTFTVQTTGWFDFRITPWVSSDDYDWALFNLTTNDCSALQNTTLLQILEESCNWSADGGITGANNLSPNTGVDCWGSAATANNPQVWVTAGSTYYLNISNYTGYGAGHGYQLDMTHGTATIYDNVRPYMQPVTAPTCGSTTINIDMSENVLCSSISAADFTLPGYVITSATSTNCASGGTQDNTITLTISPGLAPGTYTLCINGSAGHISDLCGNLTNPADARNCRSFTIPGVSTTVSAAPASICAGASSVLTAGGSTSYNWSGGLGTANPVTVTPGTTTIYTVTGTSAGCTSSASTTVTVTAMPAVSISASVNPICAGASTTLTASGATSYSWSGGLGSGASVTVSPASTTTYSVTGTSGGCTSLGTITVNVNPVPTVTASASPGSICASGSSTLTASGATSYNWSGGLGSSNPVTVSPAGTTTYTVTGTSAGCSAQGTVTVTVGGTLGIAVSASVNPVCSGGSTILTASGGSSYTWSGGLGTANPLTVTPASTTTYSVTGSDISGCTGVAAITINIGTNPSVTASASPANICTGGSSSLTASGASTYVWSGGLGSANPLSVTPASSTTYTVTGTSAAGCTGLGTVTVNVNPVTANAGSDWIQGACSTSTNTLNGSGTGTGPLTYAWTPVAGLSNPAIATPVADPAATTTYTLTVTNATGCTAVDYALVTVNTMTANAGADGNTGACPSSTYTLNGSGTGIAPLSYAWTPVTALSNPAIAGPVADPSATTTYTLTVTDAYGCTMSDAAVVNVAPLPTANAGADVTIGGCVSAANANLNGTGTGNAPLSYSWTPVTGLSNPAIANPVADPAATSNYTLMVTDSYGCTATNDMTVTVDVLPTVNAGTDIIEGGCATAANYNLAASATGTGPMTYLWATATGLSNPNILNPVANPASTTSYTISATDIYGCVATDIVLVTVDPVPTANAGTDGSISGCAITGYAINGSGTGTGPLSYAWTPVTGLSNPSIATPTALPGSTTNYTLTVTDTYGCVASDIMTVTALNVPTANAGADGTIGNCPTSTYTLTGSGTGTAPITYAWTPTTGLSNPSLQNPVANPSTTTTYTLTITDAFNCTARDYVTVNVVPLPVVSVLPVNPSICAGSNVNLTASGSTNFTWTPAGGLSSTSGASVNAAPAATTTYTVTGSDIYGCTAAATTMVTVIPLPTGIAVIPAAPSICAGESVSLTASGASTYSWAPSGGLSATSGAGVTANPGATTTYTLTGNTSGCVATTSVTVTVNPLPSVSFGSIPNICQNAAVTTLNTGTPAGGVYSGPGITGTSFNPATAGSGTHTLTYTYTDANNCTSSATQNISVLAPPALTMSPASPQVCVGGSIVLSASGASTYLWDPPTGLSATTGSSVTANPVTATTYIVTGTLNGCTSTTDITVNMYTITVQVVPDQVSICPGGYTVLTALGAATYQWSPPDGLSSTNSASVSASPQFPTTYSVTGTDGNGCIGNATAVVNVYPDVSMAFVAYPQTGCPPLPVEFEYVPSPLIQSNSWVWDFGDPASGTNNESDTTNVVHIYNEQNMYIVTLSGTTTDGCAVSSSDTIMVWENPVADFEINPLTVTTENPEIHFYDQSADAYFWSWNFGDPGSELFNFSDLQNPTHYYADSGYYQATLIVTNDHGCSDTAQKYLTVVDAFAFFIPNAFTPNDDPINPVFLPKGVGFKEDTFEMTIFDRWGKKIFYTTDLYKGWDGINPKTGKVYEEGVYTYYIQLKDSMNLDKIFHGSITLIR